jgi:hypothetical protein
VKEMPTHSIYQFCAELDDYKPRIWRRFQVAGNVTTARLGYILMTMFEMQASHLFAFELLIDGENAKHTVPEYGKIYRFELPGDESFAGQDSDCVLFDATKYKISRVLSSRGSRLHFNYDFGDGWWILLTLEDVIVDKALPAKELPRVLEGAGYGIIEDCGGMPGLIKLTQAFKKKKGKEYKELSEWLGVVDLDMSAFDVNDMNFRLKKVPRIYADIYEHNLEPTKRSIDLLERKYLKNRKEQ